MKTSEEAAELPRDECSGQVLSAQVNLSEPKPCLDPFVHRLPK